MTDEQLREAVRLLDAAEDQVLQLRRALWALADWPAEQGNYDMREYARRAAGGEVDSGAHYAEDTDGGQVGPIFGQVL